MNFGANSWTSQVYAIFLPYAFAELSFYKSLFKFKGNEGTCEIIIDYNYSFSPNVNKLELSLSLTIGTDTFLSDKLETPIGEWLLLTL